MQKPLLSKYIITWIEIVPVSGIVTKHDRRIFGDLSLMGTDYQYFKHFPSRDKALEWLDSFNKKLDKQYRCRLFTDAQYSRIRNGIVPFTRKQESEVYYI